MHESFAMVLVGIGTYGYVFAIAALVRLGLGMIGRMLMHHRHDRHRHIRAHHVRIRHAHEQHQRDKVPGAPPC